MVIFSLIVVFMVESAANIVPVVILSNAGGDLLQPVQQREEPVRQRRRHLRVRQLLAWT